jgi:transketolase
MRTNRPATEVLTPPQEPVRLGGSRVLRQQRNDAVTVVAAGVTVHEAVSAADQLSEDGIAVRVIDCYSIKPIDVATLQDAARVTGTVITVEDHAAEGGLGDAAREALADSDEPPRVTSLAVRQLPASATGAEQLHVAGIDAAHIKETVRDLLTASPSPVGSTAL